MLQILDENDKKVIETEISEVKEDTDNLKKQLDLFPKVEINDLISDSNSTFGSITTGVTDLTFSQNTLKATMPQNTGVYIKNNNLFKSGKHYKIAIQLQTTKNRTFGIVSISGNTVNNWGVGNIGSGVTQKIIDYKPTVNGDFGLYAYGNDSTITAIVKIFEVSNISDDILETIDFLTIDKKAIFLLAKKAELIDETNRNISCIGDSLTYGYGASPGTNDYPSILQTLIPTKKVYNLGVSGESSDEILARQGGYPAIINPVTIPADTSAVEITFNGNINIKGGKTVLLRKNSGDLVNPVTIDGIQGKISFSDNKYYFTRSTAGDEHKIITPQYVVTKEMIDHKNDIQIIFVGTNGGWMITADDADTRIKKITSQIDMMIDYNTSKKYIIIGMHYFYSWVLYNGLTKEQLENAMLLKYGNHYINLREFMIAYGLECAGLEATSSDQEAITKGDVPPSLLYSDGIHGNAYFYKILANLVNEKGKELGYW